MPDDDDNNGGWPGTGFNDFPPHFGITKLPPSVTTTTMSKGPFTTTVAYLVGSWMDDDGFLHTYTMTEFDDLSEAQTFAAGLGAAAPTGDPWDSMWAEYWSGYYSAAPVTTTPKEYATAPQTSYSTAPQTGIPAPSESPQSQKPEKGHNGPPIAALAAGIIVPIVVCIITIIACIFCVSHYRRRARKVEAAGLANRLSSEMREVGAAGSAAKPPGLRVANDERAYLAPSSTAPPRGAVATAARGAAAVPLVAAGAVGSQQDPPVILSTTMNNGFYTGIDTSDAVSLNDTRSMASHDTFGEEPPPPYRPRSVPPISRETSVRTSIMSATPDRNSSIRSHRNTLSSGSIIRRSNEVRSPFDDPEEEDEDDDTQSEVSTVRGRDETDRLSMVSDLSYQNSSTTRLR
jgi:hypothetical protein